MISSFHSTGSRFSVRQAQPHDAKAVRMLVPELREAAATFVAVEERHRLVIGAAAAARSTRQHPFPGPGVALHVIAPCRRFGVGTALLRHLALAARAAGASVLYAARRVVDGTDEMHGWQRLGFEPCQTVQEHSLPLDGFEPLLAPLLDRLQRHNKIPAPARIIPLYQANLAAVQQLHFDQLGGDRRELYRKLRGIGVGVFHPCYSRVLVVGDKTLGCILAHRQDEDTAVVDADIVHPRLRGGWANVWLKLEATRGALRLGIKRFHFTTFDHYNDTRSFANKLRGVVTRTSALMMRPITSLPITPRSINR